MKVIIAGTRTFNSRSLMARAMEEAARCGIIPSVVYSGCAPGADRMGELWADERGMPVKEFPADWGQYGKRAGPIRNGVMAAQAEALVCLWDGKSRGSADMIQKAKDHGLRVYVFRYDRACED